MDANDSSHPRTTAVHKRMKDIFKVSLVGNILLLLVVFCLYIARKSGLLGADVILAPNTIYRDAQGNTDSTGSRPVCITCGFNDNDVKATLYDFIIRTNISTTLCCLDNDPDIQDVILELAASRGNQYTYERSSNQKLNWWTKRDYAAHLYADHFSNVKELTWTTKRHSTSFVRNLTLSADWRKLTVPDAAGAGKYFVYSMFTFDFHDKATIKHKQEIIHKIIKYNSSSVNDSGIELWRATLGDVHMSTRQTSYLSGVVSLNKSDSIHAQAFSLSRKEHTSEKYIDDSSPYSNFFGMFKLD